MTFTSNHSFGEEVSTDKGTGTITKISFNAENSAPTYTVAVEIPEVPAVEAIPAHTEDVDTQLDG